MTSMNSVNNATMMSIIQAQDVCSVAGVRAPPEADQAVSPASESSSSPGEPLLAGPDGPLGTFQGAITML